MVSGNCVAGIFGGATCRSSLWMLSVCEFAMYTCIPLVCAIAFRSYIYIHLSTTLYCIWEDFIRFMRMTVSVWSGMTSSVQLYDSKQRLISTCKDQLKCKRNEEPFIASDSHAHRQTCFLPSSRWQHVSTLTQNENRVTTCNTRVLHQWPYTIPHMLNTQVRMYVSSLQLLPPLFK